ENAVKIAPRKLIKVVTSLKTGAEWCTSNAVESYRESNGQCCNWKALWRQNQKLIGIKLLSILKERNPEVYMEDTYAVCRKKSETLSHVLECEDLNGYWNNTEKNACYVAWRKLDNGGQCNFCRQNFKTVILGVTSSERTECRESYTRGLVPDEVYVNLYKLFLSSSEMEEEIGIFTKEKRKVRLVKKSLSVVQETARASTGTTNNTDKKKPIVREK
ncbi:21537_t:CDS:2, partial [Gigaspora margarita]